MPLESNLGSCNIWRRSLALYPFEKNFSGLSGIWTRAQTIPTPAPYGLSYTSRQKVRLGYLFIQRAPSNPVRSCIDFILSWIFLSPTEDTTRHCHLFGILNPIVLWTYLRRLNIPQWLNIYLAISVSFNAFRILSRILQYMKKKIGTVSFRKNFWVERDLNPGPRG